MGCLNMIKENEEKVKYLSQVEMKKILKGIETYLCGAFGRI